MNICSKQWYDAKYWYDIFSIKHHNYFNPSVISNQKFAYFLGIVAIS